MSATRCPVCHSPKDKPWHLVCAACWTKVPMPDRELVYEQYKKARGSKAHREICMRIVYSLAKKRLLAEGAVKVS